MVLKNFLENLYFYLTENGKGDDNIIRRHTKKLDKLGDLSFPICMQNWYHLLQDKNKLQHVTTIFEYLSSENHTLEEHMAKLLSKSASWDISFVDYKIIKNDVFLFIERVCVYKATLCSVLQQLSNYGAEQVLSRKFVFSDLGVESKHFTELDLCEFRILLLKQVITNLIRRTSPQTGDECEIMLIFKSYKTAKDNILCGPVLNENGLKDISTTAQQFIDKRTSDMRMMAQHKYGVQINSMWKEYFEKLGKAAVCVEMLSNKPHKAIKITLNDLSASNKGASFIFYNCARMAKLFKEFDRRVEQKVYPALPDLNEIDFSLLNQNEEWELLYVYVLYYPMLLKNCIKNIENGIVNPHYLISFLSNLSSLFSVYYRRVKILTDSREHLFGTIHSRIYLLKAVQQVFHNALSLLNIEPIREM